MESTSNVFNILLSLLKEKEKLSLKFYLTRHTKQDEKYKSVEYELSKKLKEWLLGNMISEITFSDVEELEKIQITKYNHEFSLNDSISELDLNSPDFIGIKEINENLLNSISKADKNEFIIKSNFQTIEITSEEESFYVCYYRGIKKSSGKRKYLGIISGNIEENAEAFFDIGGNVSFVIYKEQIFIFRVKDFEYAYKYTSHISEKRDENIDKIVNLELFSDKESADNFRNKSGNYLYARGIAEMGETQLSELKSNYEERCKELKKIKESLEKDPSNEDELRSENGILVDLLDFIDFENENKLIITEETNLTPILHFIQDKIVESFLTKKVKTIIGYQKG